MSSPNSNDSSKNEEEIEATNRFSSARSRTFEVKLSRYHRRKRIFDMPVACFLLIPSVPLIFFLGMLVKLTSKGPAFYSQIRVGKNGRTFKIYKIRTMRIDAEAETGAVWAAKKDPRVTFLGKILRKLHLDEIPQLVNVIRGEMSLVGPRPERPEFVEVLDQKIEGYALRLLVVPGVTGYAQLNLPSDRELNDVRRKLALDMEYVEGASFWFDVRLILGTVFRFFKYAPKTPLRLLGIYRTAENSSWAERCAVPGADEVVALLGEQRLDLIFENATKRVAPTEFHPHSPTVPVRTGTTPRQLEPAMGPQ